MNIGLYRHFQTRKLDMRWWMLLDVIRRSSENTTYIAGRILGLRLQLVIYITLWDWWTTFTSPISWTRSRCKCYLLFSQATLSVSTTHSSLWNHSLCPDSAVIPPSLLLIARIVTYVHRTGRRQRFYFREKKLSGSDLVGRNRSTIMSALAVTTLKLPERNVTKGENVLHLDISYEHYKQHISEINTPILETRKIVAVGPKGYIYAVILLSLV